MANKKTKDQREQLIQLGSEPLADALIDLAQYNDEASNLVERLIATPKENISRFKKMMNPGRDFMIFSTITKRSNEF